MPHRSTLSAAEQSPAAHSERPQAHWRLDPLAVLAALLAVLATASFTYTPMVSWFSQRAQSAQISAYQQEVRDGTAPQPKAAPEPEQILEAQEYNSALASGAVIESFANVARGVGEAEGSEFVYDDLLAIGDAGLMGRLRIPVIEVDLPIYHGTSEQTLLKGVGHLQGTSLPVGGEGTRTVLTAHRGLASATLFTNLDKVKVGDVFTVSVLDRVYAYEVFDISVIAPEESEALQAVPGEDQATLITCTPLGINSHRILVTGKRVYPLPKAIESDALQAPTLPHFPWWIVVQASMVVVIGVFIWWSGRPKRKRERKSNRELELRS